MRSSFHEYTHSNRVIEMASVNEVILIGNLGASPENGAIPSG